MTAAASSSQLPEPWPPRTFETPGEASWFVKDRFGLFIHWGLYAAMARHEWGMSREKLSPAQYRKYFEHFDPDLYDPEAWADLAADAGMKYFVVTTKHHDGFCLWDSAHTDFKSTKAPAGRDLLAPMVKAFNDRGLRTGLYHSLIDWTHKDYVLDRANHPQRESAEFDPLNEGRDMARYRQYLHAQVKELLERFSPEVLWFDFSFVDKQHRNDLTKGKGREAWGSEALYRMIRKLAPDVLLTNRLDLELPLSGGDFLTPEQAQPRQWVTTTDASGAEVPVVWEACQTLYDSWGYRPSEPPPRSVEALLKTLIDCVSKGGNLLLNVGPTGRGEIDAASADRLRGIGRWLRRHGRSIYGCTQAPPRFETPRDCRLTFNPETKRLYVHLLGWPYKFFHLDGEAYVNEVDYAQWLHDGSECQPMPADDWHVQHLHGGGGPSLTLQTPIHPPEPTWGATVPVIELFLKR